MGKLDGKVALVTGASSGIGAAIASSLAAEGATVAINYRSDGEGANRVAREIETGGGKAKAFMADVSDETAVDRLFTDVQAAFGPIDTVVNNAGVFKPAPLSYFSVNDYRMQFDINVLGAFLVCKRALQSFPQAGGTITNIVTAGIASPGPYLSLYTASKAALAAMTRSLAKELAAKAIRVNAVAPGATDSEGFRASRPEGDFVEQLVAMTPLGRLGRPDDIAPVVVFLASDDARWITGEVIFASGGLK